MAFKRSTLRYSETPEPVTPYQKAAQVWDERIGSARVQAHNWRLIALGSLSLSLILSALLLWLGNAGTAGSRPSSCRSRQLVPLCLPPPMGSLPSPSAAD